MARRKMRDVGEGASLDSAVLAIGFPEEDSRRGVAVGHGGDVHAYKISQNPCHAKQNINTYMLTL